MNEVLSYFQNRIAECNLDKKLLLEKIHRSQIELDLIEKKIENIDQGIDKTSHVFSVKSPKESFNTKETNSLNTDKKNITDFIETSTQKVMKLDQEIKELNELKKKVSDTQKHSKSYDGLDILSVQEQERQRIARDIHDSIVQKMTALVHKSEFVEKVMDTDILRAKLEIEVINKVVKDCISELRGIIFDLRPMSLDDLGLETTLRRCIVQYNASSDMNISLNYHDIAMKINPIISITMLRIVQELCSNSLKYSEGKEIKVEVYEKHNTIYLIHEDDGVGFDINCTKKVQEDSKSGFGLQFLKERVELLNGRIAVGKNEENKGVRYEIEIPVLNEEKS